MRNPRKYSSAGLPLAVLLSFAPAPLAAQPAPAPPAPAAAPSTAVAETPPDPARLALAQRLVPLVMPAELIESMLSDGFPGVDTMLDMTPAQIGLGAELGFGEADQQRSMSELAVQRDPHFRERMTIRNRIMGEELRDVVRAAMPDFQRAMAEVLARRFDGDELNQMISFFSTPVGRRYATFAVTMMQDPGFIRAIGTMMPRLVEAFAGIEERVRAASAHLPPEPSPPADDAADAAED